MAAVKTKLGRIACEGCGHPVLVKENEAGTLTIQCDECDVSYFAKKNTAAQARWRAKLAQGQVAGSVPKAEPKPAKKEPEAQPPGRQPKAQPFDILGAL